MKPLQLFILANVVYYFSLTLFSATTFTTPLATQLHMNNYYPSYANRQVNQKLQKEQISYETLEKKYNERTSVLSKTLIFPLAPPRAIGYRPIFQATGRPATRLGGRPSSFNIASLDRNRLYLNPTGA